MTGRKPVSSCSRASAILYISLMQNLEPQDIAGRGVVPFSMTMVAANELESSRGGNIAQSQILHQWTEHGHIPEITAR